MNVRYEHWEDDEYVILLENHLCGQTLHKQQAETVKMWLKTLTIKDLAKVLFGQIIKEEG